ncbi:MAG TPA: serine hydrolase domain-containing protein, partial [Acetobacteraceae bacterium]|nr:serine hydrolase domain-containing protein [Acetobacteraceae bacterium]
MSKTEAVAILMQKAVQQGALPGVVVAAGSRHDVILEYAAGVRRLGAAERMTRDTVVWIASMTKAVVAAAAMRLVEQRRLSLDAPAAAVLPTLGQMPVLEGFDASGEPMLRPARRPMTLRHLLTHTSGYGYDTWSPAIQRYMKAKGIPRVATCRNAALDLPLLFDPGEDFAYGIGIDWVGKMVEAVTGQRLGEHLDETFFGPLGMVDTSFRLRPDMRARLAPIHHRAADGTLTP